MRGVCVSQPISRVRVIGSERRTRPRKSGEAWRVEERMVWAAICRTRRRVRQGGASSFVDDVARAGGGEDRVSAGQEGRAASWRIQGNRYQMGEGERETGKVGEVVARFNLGGRWLRGERERVRAEREAPIESPVQPFLPPLFLPARRSGKTVTSRRAPIMCACCDSSRGMFGDRRCGWRNSSAGRRSTYLFDPKSPLWGWRRRRRVGWVELCR